MRKIFIVSILIMFTGLAFVQMNIMQITTAQVELPTNTNVTLLNETATNNNTVSNATGDITIMDEKAKP
jgi:hypothetical protein